MNFINFLIDNVGAMNLLYFMGGVTLLGVIVWKGKKGHFFHENYEDLEYEDYIEGLREEEAFLLMKIEEEKAKLATIKTQRVNRENGLTKQQEHAVQVYDDLNIHLPLEIIEEIQYVSPVTMDDTMKLIENKRQNMKAELSKKIYYRK